MQVIITFISPSDIRVTFDDELTGATDDDLLELLSEAMCAIEAKRQGLQYDDFF